jgi:hypothetical protein
MKGPMMKAVNGFNIDVAGYDASHEQDVFAGSRRGDGSVELSVPDDGMSVIGRVGMAYDRKFFWPTRLDTLIASYITHTTYDNKKRKVKRAKETNQDD